jgi:hypothetical protein
MGEWAMGEWALLVLMCPTLAFIIAGFDLTQPGAQDVTGGTCSPLDALGRLRDRPLSLHNRSTFRSIADLQFECLLRRKMAGSTRPDRSQSASGNACFIPDIGTSDLTVSNVATISMTAAPATDQNRTV